MTNKLEQMIYAFKTIIDFINCFYFILYGKMRWDDFIGSSAHKIQEKKKEAWCLSFCLRSHQRLKLETSFIEYTFEIKWQCPFKQKYK